MRPVLEVLMPALLWAVVVWRAPSALRDRAPRSLWATFTCIALSLTTRPPAIARFLETGTGVRDVTLLVKHLLAMTAMCFIVDYIQAVHPKAAARPDRVRLRYLLTVTAALAMTVLFVFFLPHDLDGAYGIDAHYGHPAVRLYLAVVYLFLGASTAQAAAVFWVNRRSVPRGLPRVGMGFLAASAATGFVYTLYRVCYVLYHGEAVPLAPEGHPVPLTDPVSELLPAVSIVLLVLGVSIPPARALSRYARDQYALWRLYPLWADVTAAVPDVVLGTPVSRIRDVFVLGDRTLDVAHRAFAIRDAALALRDDIPASPTPAQRPGPYDAQSPGDGDPARTEARWLHAAVRSRAEGRPAPPLPAPLARTSGGRTPRGEVAWLLRVAAAYPGRVPRPAEGRTPAAAVEAG